MAIRNTQDQKRTKFWFRKLLWYIKSIYPNQIEKSIYLKTQLDLCLKDKFEPNPAMRNLKKGPLRKDYRTHMVNVFASKYYAGFFSASEKC